MVTKEDVEKAYEAAKAADAEAKAEWLRTDAEAAAAWNAADAAAVAAWDKYIKLKREYDNGN